MNVSMTFRELQSKIVTHLASGKRFSPNGESIGMMWWTKMTGKLSYLGLESFPETLTITDTDVDKNPKVYNYKVSERTDEKVVYVSEELPSLPIHLRVA